MNKLSLLLLLTAGLACATPQAPPELVDARKLYIDASRGPAAQLDPTSLRIARQSLDEAELAFEEHPRDPWVRDSAYIAGRRALFADAQARMFLAQRQEARGRDELADIAAQASAELRAARKSISDAQEQSRRTEAELESERARGAVTSRELEDAAKALDEERAARAAAEAIAKEALDDLARTASVKEDARGVVITLSGQVLFASGKAALLPAARDALDNVADALKANGKRDITVEGHTDSMGTDSTNEDLSQRRAVAVREYLVEQGVQSEMIRAVGRGEEEPVDSNDTPEGRANNRRVEIVLSKE